MSTSPYRPNCSTTVDKSAFYYCLSLFLDVHMSLYTASLMLGGCREGNTAAIQLERYGDRVIVYHRIKRHVSASEGSVKTSV